MQGMRGWYGLAGALALTLCSPSARGAEKADAMETRWYTLGATSTEGKLMALAQTFSQTGEKLDVDDMPLPTANKRPAARQDHYRGAVEGVWKDAFAEYGVAWPEGSRIRHLPQFSQLLVHNTPGNHTLIEAVLMLSGMTPLQVQITVEFVSFPLATLESATRTNLPLSEALAVADREGRGKLEAAPTILTQSGNEATVKAVIEERYPTEITSEAFTGAATNGGVCGVATLPGGFETREVGCILMVLPEIAPDRQTISVTLASEQVALDNWRPYEVLLGHATGVAKTALPQPEFADSSLQTQLRLRPGSRLLVGGGMPLPKGNSVVCKFITCRLLDMEGREVNPPNLTALGRALLAE